MKAVFFVYTPFQMMVSQLIASQEGLKESVLIEGYVGNNKHFLEIYDMLKVASLWGKTYIMPELPQWDGLVIRSFNDVRKAHRNFNFLKSIIKENQVDTLFLGENKNQSIRFTAKVFFHLGYKIAFFEEGLAHYISTDVPKKSGFQFNLKVCLRDVFYYLPLYHVCFAKWRYQPRLPLDATFPKYSRYSILPVFNGENEYRVSSHFEYSEKLRTYLEKNVKNEEGIQCVLLLTQPLDEAYSEVENFEDVYVNVIDEALHEISETAKVYIKFHPRDTGILRKRLLKLLNDKNIKYGILSQEINLPVEIFLQHMKFEKVFFFYSSTFAYNGYLFPKQQFVCLLPQLNKKCVDIAGHDFDYYHHVMSFFDELTKKIKA